MDDFYPCAAFPLPRRLNLDGPLEKHPRSTQRRRYLRAMAQFEDFTSLITPQTEGIDSRSQTIRKVDLALLSCEYLPL